MRPITLPVSNAPRPRASVGSVQNFAQPNPSSSATVSRVMLWPKTYDRSQAPSADAGRAVDLAENVVNSLMPLLDALQSVAGCCQGVVSALMMLYSWGIALAWINRTQNCRICCPVTSQDASRASTDKRWQQVKQQCQCRDPCQLFRCGTYLFLHTGSGVLPTCCCICSRLH